MHDPQAATAANLVGVLLLREAASVLGSAGVELMPLKGIWLQQLVYASPGERLITDVDVLVRETAFEPALAALLSSGFVLRSRDVGEAALVLPGYPLPLDLHHSLFTRFAFALRTEDAFARGIADRESFGAALVLPDPLDVFAHLVGHFVKSRASPSDKHALRDFEAIATRFTLEPAACARHLEATGLARAARYVFADSRSSVYGAQVVAALAPDPLGSALARGLARAAQHVSGHSRALALSGYLLDRSIPAGLLSLAARVQDKLSRPS